MTERLQCKDLSTRQVLSFLAEHKGHWATWCSSILMPSVGSVFPDAPPKLVLAKLSQLVNKGYVKGCACGCRGDFEITDKGEEKLKELSK